MPARPSRLAVLIDLDPEEPGLLGRVLEQAATYGTIGIRRAYGNRKKLLDWEACLQYRGIDVVGNYGSGANAADITLIIDSVDMLRTGKADGFCIVASDHHYMGLVRWLRNEKVFVAGIGKKTAPDSFRDAFGDRFTNVEDLPRQTKVPDGPCWDAERALVGRIKRAIDNSSKLPEEYVRLSVVRACLGDFSARSYCHSDLVSLVRQYENEFDVMDGRSIGKSAGDYVRTRTTSK